MKKRPTATPGDELLDTRNRYLEAALRGDVAAAGELVERALDAGHSFVSVCLSVLMPAQVEVGARWERGQITIAHEHLATQITETQLQRLRERQRPREQLGLRAVVASVEGEGHVVGTRLVADLLALDGWDVQFLGANTPAEDLVELCKQNGAHLVVLAATLPPSLIPLRRTSLLLRRLEPAPKILAGGAALAGLSGPNDSVSADYVTADPLEAIRAARQLVGQQEEEASPLSSRLRELGTRLLELRRARGLSQQELAERAELDRTYVSAVERGRQNLTLGAILKLAGALDTSLDDLLGLKRS